MKTALPHGNCNPENNHWAAAACWWRLLSLEFRAQWVKYPSWGQWRLCRPLGFHSTCACCALHSGFLLAGKCPLHFMLSPHVRPAQLFLPALGRKTFHLHLHPSLSPCLWPSQPQQHSPLWSTGPCLGQSLDRMCLNLLSLCLFCFQRGQFFAISFIFAHVFKLLKKPQVILSVFICIVLCLKVPGAVWTNFRYVQPKYIHMEIKREQKKMIQRPSLCLADGEQFCGRTGTRMSVSFAASALSSVLTYHEPKYILKCVLLSQLLLSESGKALGQPTWRFVSVSL